VLSVVLTALGALAFAPSAFAATTYTVNNTGDASGDTCLGGADPCSLRSAIEQADANAGADTINFDATTFNGTAASSTIEMNISSPMLVTEAVTIDGTNGGTNICVTGSIPKPCAGVDASAGENTAISIQPSSSNVAIDGIAFTGFQGSAIQSQGSGTSVTHSWFGLKLDGTTLTPNDAGVGFIAGASGTIANNVFPKSGETGVTLFNDSGSTVKGNYFGAMPDGTPVTDPGSHGITINSSDDNTIGGSPITAGHCDGDCNLIIGYGGDGIQFADDINPSDGNNVYGNFIGLELNGTTGQGNGDAGVSAFDSTNTTIGGTGKPNYIDDNGSHGVAAEGGSSLNVSDNYIGLSADGTASIPNRSSGPSGLGIRADMSGDVIVGNRLGGNGITVGGNATVTGNVIGVGPSGQAFTVNEAGLFVDGDGGTIGGTNPGDGNTIGNVNNFSNSSSETGALVLESGASNNTILGNYIGTTSTGIAAPNIGEGIRLAGANDANNTIGGATAESENVISNSSKDAIKESGPGTGNRFLRNVGKNNGSTANDLFVDLGNDGPGNPVLPNGGIEAPAGLSVTSTSISGTALPDARVRAYATYTSQGNVRSFLDATVANHITGAWTINFPSPLPNGSCVTANQTADVTDNSSEMATALAVGGGSCVVPPSSSIDSGPADGSTITNRTPTFGFISEAGATLQCKIDSGAFTACSSPFTTPVLTDGQHTFTERAVLSTNPLVNPALLPELGVQNSRTFTVDTTGPTAAITSGPGAGTTIGSTTATFGYTTQPLESSATFQCKLDAGAFSPCGGSKTLTALGQGAHTFSVRAVDTLGNIGAVAARSFRVDTTPPTAKVGKVKVKGRTAKISFSGTDPAGAAAPKLTFKCKLDKGKLKPCRSPKTYKKLKPGKHKVFVQATDSVGNVGKTAKKSFKIKKG
jgi:hypothetical protein